MAGKYIVRCDIEGASGVVSYEQAEPGRPEFVFGRGQFMADLTALVNGLNDGGADLIVVYDEHYYGRNVDLGLLPANVQVICGKPPYLPDWPGGLDRSFRGLILLGYHSKRGTPEGLLCHTYEPDIREMRLNGLSVGEIGIEAAVAGDFGVPLVLMTGDSAGVAEARALVPDAVYVTVKEALSETGGICYPLAQTNRLINSAARLLASGDLSIAPYSVGEDVCLEVLLAPGAYLDRFRALNPRDMKDETTVKVRARNATTAYSRYWLMKNHCLSNMKG